MHVVEAEDVRQRRAHRMRATSRVAVPKHVVIHRGARITGARVTTDRNPRERAIPVSMISEGGTRESWDHSELGRESEPSGYRGRNEILVCNQHLKRSWDIRRRGPARGLCVECPRAKQDDARVIKTPTTRSAGPG